MPLSPPHELIFTETGVYLPSEETFVIADLHLGYTDTHSNQFTSPEYSTILQKIETLTDQYSITTFIIAGDILDDFSTVPQAITDFFNQLNSLFTACGIQGILIQGNHDTMLDSTIAPKFFTVTDEYQISTAVGVIHGHTKPNAQYKLLIIGHHHPVFTIEGAKWKGFLYGIQTYYSQNILVLPAFHPSVTGSTPIQIDASDITSPIFMEGDEVQEYHPILHKGETKVFPKVKEVTFL